MLYNVLHHAVENRVANTNNATYARRMMGRLDVQCNTVKYTTAFLYSDWLHFLWHGIKQDMQEFQIQLFISSLMSIAN